MLLPVFIGSYNLSCYLLERERRKGKKNVTGDHSSGRNNGTLFSLVSTMWHICDEGNLTVILDRDCDWKMLWFLYWDHGLSLGPTDLD